MANTFEERPYDRHRPRRGRGMRRLALVLIVLLLLGLGLLALFGLGRLGCNMGNGGGGPAGEGDGGQPTPHSQDETQEVRTETNESNPTISGEDPPSKVVPFYVFRFELEGDRALWRGTLSLPDGSTVAVAGERPHDWTGFTNDLTRHFERHNSAFPENDVLFVIPRTSTGREAVRQSTQNDLDTVVRNAGKRPVWHEEAEVRQLIREYRGN